MGYLYLILFKLSRYYNSFLKIEKKKRKYFKNALFFAVRHDNNVLYDEVKKKMTQLFLPQLNQMYNGNENEINKTIAGIIQRLIVQPDILSENFIDQDTKIRKNVLNPENVMEKNTSRYGDPEFSLISYFHFFENPTDTSYNVTEEGELVTNEWFIMADIDTLSAKMDLKDDIVLIEFRGFQKMLSNYVFNIGDDYLKNMMRNGICNELSKYYNEDIGLLSLGIVKRFLQLQKAKKDGKKINKTNKNRRKYKRKELFL